MLPALWEGERKTWIWGTGKRISAGDRAWDRAAGERSPGGFSSCWKTTCHKAKCSAPRLLVEHLTKVVCSVDVLVQGDDVLAREPGPGRSVT